MSLEGFRGGSFQGRLLVADPRLADPNFERTVVLLLAHGSDGAVGLVLNRPGATEVGDALADWGHLAAAPAVVFQGGPVEPGGVICLALRRPAPPPADTHPPAEHRPVAGRQPPAEGQPHPDAPAWQEILGPLGVFHLDGGPPEAAGNVEELRFFAGYAGWAPGQLEAEIEAGGWFVVGAEPSDALSSRPSQLWREVLRRQPPPLAYVAAYPADPDMN